MDERESDAYGAFIRELGELVSQFIANRSEVILDGCDCQNCAEARLEDRITPLCWLIQSDLADQQIKEIRIDKDRFFRIYPDGARGGYEADGRVIFDFKWEANDDR